MDSIKEIIQYNNANRLENMTILSNDRRTKKDDHSSCPLCSGMGFVVPNLSPGDPGFGKAVPCVCKKTELAQRSNDKLVAMSQLGALQEQTFAKFLPKGLSLAPDKAKSLYLAYQSAKTFADAPTGWLLLKGSYGCGKTHLAAAIANTQLANGRQVLFVTTPDLLDHLRSTYSPQNNVSYDDRFEQVKNTPLLILDDFGAQNNSDWAAEKLYQIINHRYNARLPMVVTTNQDMEAIDMRVRSRLSDFSFVKMINILAPDFRRGGVYQEESDLSSLDLHGDHTFESFDLRGRELKSGQAQNLQRAYNTVQDYAADPQGWLVLNSLEYGCGKTHLAAAAANAVSARGQTVLFIVVPDLLDHLRATFDPGTGTRLDKRFNQVKKAQLLVLDDLGTESATAWAREKLYQLFNYRYNANLPTIITTATPIDQIDPRLASRFLDGNRCTFFVIESPGYRVSRKKRKRTNQSHKNIS